MDKGRHPHVIRTWTVERTKAPVRLPQMVRPRVDPRKEHFHAPEVKPHAAVPMEKKAEE